MNRSISSILLLILFSMTLSCSSTRKSKDIVQRPNIIFFLVDDLGWMDTGYQGSKLYETPNIDRLATEGMVFNNAYAAHPRCVPSRYAIITGRYPARAKMPGPGEGKLKAPGGVTAYPGDESNLRPEEYTLANALREGGYKTFFTGKWHLASAGTLPEHVGFDINIGGGEAGSPISYFFPYNEGRQAASKAPIHGLEEGVEGEYLTDRLTGETENFIRKHVTEHPDQPFLAYVSHYAVHQPIEAKDPDIERYRKKLKGINFDGQEYISEGTGTTKMWQDDPVYAAMIKNMDESLGRINSLLKELEIDENTIIIFFSDNGGLSNRGYNPRTVPTSNYPLRAGKGHLYEGGIREPMIVKWPGVTDPGSASNAIITGTDFFPTFLEMAGLPLRPEAHLDGESFAWALRGGVSRGEDRAIYWHSPVSRPQSTGDENSSAIRIGNYKLIEFYDDDRVELYDLSNDIGESNDLSTEMQDVKERLLKRLKDWRNETGAWTRKQ